MTGQTPADTRVTEIVDHLTVDIDGIDFSHNALKMNIRRDALHRHVRRI
mgnify:CR=1 FL=1